MFYKGFNLENIKEKLREKATEEDAKLVIDAIERTKKLGAKSFEDTVYMLETELRMVRKKEENQEETYERIADRLTNEIHRQRDIIRGIFELGETLEAIRGSGEVNINITINTQKEQKEITTK